MYTDRFAPPDIFSYLYGLDIIMHAWSTDDGWTDSLNAEYTESVNFRLIKMMATIQYRIGFTSCILHLQSQRFMYYSLSAVTASAQELVTCYQRDRCSSSGGVFEGVTMQACCDNINGGESLDGLGLGTSFQQDGVEGCTPCPVG